MGLLTVGTTHMAQSSARNIPLIHSILALCSFIHPPLCVLRHGPEARPSPVCSLVNLPTETVSEAAQEPVGYFVLVIRARDSPMVLHHIVPHSGALGCFVGSEVT